MAGEDIHEEPSEDPVVEYFVEESTTASKLLDVEVHEGGMQFEDDIHSSGHSIDLDGAAEESNQELEEELPNIGLEQEADNGEEQEADSGEEQEADSGEEQEADSGEQQEADSGEQQEANSGSHCEYDEPLYPGAAITVSIAMTLLLAFVVHHKLSNEAIADLLYLIDHICPKPNRCCRTLYKFKKFFFFGDAIQLLLLLYTML